MPLSASEHRQIVKAIASGDAELAGRAMFEHVAGQQGPHASRTTAREPAVAAASPARAGRRQKAAR